MNPTNYLSKIIEKKKQEVSELYASNNSIEDNTSINETPFLFSKKLSSPQLHLIAEIKKASPSKGLINPNFDPTVLAQSYAKTGASCLSVLTEKHYFQGHPDYIKPIYNAVKLPILRKDFIIDPIQITESKKIGAHAILLILAILTNETAQELLTHANQLGLDVLIETHTADEMALALTLTGQFMIGINNRNLSTFDVDINAASDLKSQFQSQLKDKVIIAESGYTNATEMTTLQNNGFNGVLIGEGLVTHPSLQSYFKQ